MSEETTNAQANIPGVLVAQMIMEFQREFAGSYGNDTFHSSLCAVGPLQSMIGLAIRNGHITISPPKKDRAGK